MPDPSAAQDRVVARKVFCASVMLGAVAVYTIWHKPTVAWVAGIVFGVALVGLMRP